MSRLAFVYKATIRLLDPEEGSELIGDDFDSALLDYDDSNEEGHFGQAFELARGLIAERFPGSKEGDVFVVFLAGRMMFTTDYYNGGEVDMDLEIEWSHVEAQRPEVLEEGEAIELETTGD